MTLNRDNTGSNVEKVLLHPWEASQALSISRSRLYELMATGEVRSVKIGRSRRIPVVAMHEYVAGLNQSA